MGKITDKIKTIWRRSVKILLTLWQLPQCVVGWFLEYTLKNNVTEERGMLRFIYSEEMKGSISLGRVIILAEHYNNDEDEKVEKHEYGHSLQSTILGPLYLVVIGVPSLLWAAFYKGDENGYYTKFYTEKWADKLGGVER